MKKVVINAALDFVMRSLLDQLSVDDLHRIALKYSQVRCSDEAKRQYILDRVRAIEHGCSEYSARLVTEIAFYQLNVR